MRPCRAFTADRLEAALYDKCLRCGLGEDQVAAVVAKQDIAIGVQYARRAANFATLLPCDFARGKLDTCRIAAVGSVTAVDVAIDEDHAAVLVLKVPRLDEIDLPGSKAAIFADHLDECSPGIVGCRYKNIIAANDRRGDVGYRVGDAVIAPQKPARFGVDAYHSAAQHLNILPNAVYIRSHSRRIASAVDTLIADLRQFACPDRRACKFIQCDHGCIVAARRADNLIAVEKRRFAVLPAGHHHPAKIIGQTLLPPDRTRRCVKTYQIALSPQSINKPAVNRRRTPRTIVMAGPYRSGPESSASLNVKGNDELRLHLIIGGKIAHRKKSSIGYRNRGKSPAQPLDLPKQL